MPGVSSEPDLPIVSGDTDRSCGDPLRAIGHLTRFGTGRALRWVARAETGLLTEGEAVSRPVLFFHRRSWHLTTLTSRDFRLPACRYDR